MGFKRGREVEVLRSYCLLKTRVCYMGNAADNSDNRMASGIV